MTDLEIYNLILETISNKPDLLEMLNVKIIEDDLHVNVRQTLDEVVVATFHMSTKNCSMVGMLINNMLYPSENITMEFLKESENEIVREVVNPALLDLILNQYESLSLITFDRLSIINMKHVQNVRHILDLLELCSRF